MLCYIRVIGEVIAQFPLSYQRSLKLLLAELETIIFLDEVLWLMMRFLFFIDQDKVD